MKRRIRLSYICFGSGVLSSVALSPLFGNFTTERLPGLLVVAIVLSLAWGFVAGTFLRVP